MHKINWNVLKILVYVIRKRAKHKKRKADAKI